MGVLPSTQPVATLGFSFIWSSFDMACTCCVPYVEATVFGVDHTSVRIDLRSDILFGDDTLGQGTFGT